MRLDALLEQRGDTERAAADALGVTLATYQRLERGQEWDGSKPVTIDRRTALACAAIRAGLAPEGTE